MTLALLEALFHLLAPFFVLYAVYTAACAYVRYTEGTGK